MDTTSIIIYLIASVFAVVAVVFLANKKKKIGNANKFVWVVLFGVVATFLFLWQSGTLAQFGLAPLVGVATQYQNTNPPLATGGELCAVEDTTVTFTAVDKFSSTAVGGTHRYRVSRDGSWSPALEVADKGTATLSPGDQVEVLWENGSAIVGYFSGVKTESVPCKGTWTVSDSLYSNGTVTLEVYNEEGNKIDGANNETLSAGDVVTLEAKVKGTYQKGIPYGGVIVVEYNKTAYDDVIIDFGGNQISVPPFYTATTNYQTKAYSVPAILSNQILDGKVTIDVDDAQDPVDLSGADTLNMTFYPYNYYIDENQGGAFMGPAVSDEKDVQAYGHTTKYRVQIL
jgi:hypothetical protein